MSARTRKITYKELFETCGEFESDEEAYDEAWVQARKFVDWKNLHSLSPEEIENRVILFLNRWACRLPKDTRLAIRIKDAYQQSIPFLNALNNETLQDFDLNKRKTVEEREYANGEIALEIFRKFCAIGYNFREVAASKVLHMINPCLFIMWDTSICEAYGVKKSPSEYVYDFIPLMKLKANEVLQSYMDAKKCTRQEALNAIVNFKPGKTLAKLLDEYNYIKYTRGL